MSYILDALRRAEADRERERGHVPGLHAQPRTGGTAAPAAAGPRRWLPWAGGGALLLSLFLLLLLLARSGPADPPAPPAPPLPRQVELASPVPAPMSAPASPQPAISGAAAAVLASRPAPASAPAPAVVLPAPLAPPPSSLPPVPARPALAAATVAPAAPAPRAASAAAPIPRLAELPESTRRELPALAVSGSVYSEDPASRFLIANGEVLREGAKLGPEHVLEQIGPRELVLRFKGQRYRQAL